MSPAATKVFPSSIFTSYSNNKQQQRRIKSRFTSDDNSGMKLTPTTELAGEDSVVLTVWKKSLLMNCNGFTVYDGKGNLVYRVDNYVAGNRGEIILMDATGKPLLTIRRKRLSLGDSWMIYDGEKTRNPNLCVRKNVHLLNSKTLAQVTTGTGPTTTMTTSASSPLLFPKRKNGVVYTIEGSYAQRSVSVYDSSSSRRCVAEIRRKETIGGVSLGVDVFSLVVSRSDIDTTTAMGFVIMLEQMFGSSYLYSSHTRRYYS